VLTLLFIVFSGDAYAPVRYETDNGYRLGKWQSHQRNIYMKGKLSPERIKRLEDIGLKWKLTDVKQDRHGWDFWYGLTLKYKDEFGVANAPVRYKTPEGYPLGIWQSNQRVIYRKGKLSSERIKRFEEIGFTWDLLEEQFEKGFQETLIYKQNTGNPNTPVSYETDNGYRLGSWQSGQRMNYKKGTLSADRIKWLEDIGFKWKLTDVKQDHHGWDFWYGLTLKYKDEFGVANAPDRYETDNGYRLGKWQSHQRNIYMKGKLSPERIKQLEDIGLTWKLTDVKQDRHGWDFWYGLTLKYIDEFGEANAPVRYKTPEGYQIGIWQNNQRMSYRKGKLSSERIKRLEEIGITWQLLDEMFELGFLETLQYMKNKGDPNAPVRYETDNGYQLGRWQGHQRLYYMTGKLSPDRIKRLEDIGFKWKVRR
jgi:hypothetical protein